MSHSNRMTKHVEQYLTMRRRFGYQLGITGQQLHRFASFLDTVAPGRPLTVDLALQWAQSSSTGKQTTAACRLRFVRPFARYMRTIDPRTEVPPHRLLGPAQHRFDPHIYTNEQIQTLIDAAKNVNPPGGLRPETFATYIGLLVSTGMRPQEPLRLIRDDVDLKAKIITIRKSKFFKSRLVALHPTAAKALQRYAQLRDRFVPCPRSTAFFLRDDGMPFTHNQAGPTFARLRRRLGWASLKPTPRLYDLRHTFVCRRLLSWYRTERDVHVLMPALSTYLGHAKITHTYWYVSGILDLMHVASTRFEKFQREVQR